MSWTSAYRVALHLLPAVLRRKHGPAMEALFARELGHARERGRLHCALTGAMAVWDIVRRGAYELVHRRGDSAGECRDHGPRNRWNLNTDGPQLAGVSLGGQHMPQPTTRQLVRCHAVSFAIAFVALTASQLALFAAQRVPPLSARGAPTGTIVEMLLLAVPFIAALTIPMAVLIAVLREFTRLRADGTLAAVRRERNGIHRLIIPVLGFAAGVAVLALVVTAEILPRANERLATVLTGGAAVANDRTMTIGELRKAAQTVQASVEPVTTARAAAYEVEVQKKLALPAACFVLALVGVAIVLLVPRGGAWLIIGASCAVFGAYYVLLVAGEDLANRLVVSPLLGMWGANALFLSASLLVIWRGRAPFASSGSGAVVIRG